MSSIVEATTQLEGEVAAVDANREASYDQQIFETGDESGSPEALLESERNVLAASAPPIASGDVARTWLALVLVAAGIVCATMLLFFAVAVFDVGFFGFTVFTLWPFATLNYNGHCVNVEREATTMRPLIDHAVASAPTWLRNTLLMSFVVK
eukprot:SAG11_NODE_15236_length_584_cov_1.224742_2_plen_151_part_01